MNKEKKKKTPRKSQREEKHHEPGRKILEGKELSVRKRKEKEKLKAAIIKCENIETRSSQR